MLNDIISLLKLKKGDIVVVTRVGRGFIWCRVGLKAGKSGLGTSMFQPSTHQNDLDLDG